MQNIFKITKSTKILILIMSIIVLTGLGTAFIYYGNINKSEDPRIIEARYKYKKYNELIEQNDFDGVLLILDTIESIYSKYEDYKNSFEIGVVYNNRAAAYLANAIYQKDTINDSLLIIAKQYTLKSIEIYKNWISTFDKMSESQLKEYFKPYYTENEPVFNKKRLNQYLNKRVKNTIVAKKETKRRISVSYANLGIIYRHQENIDSALINYKLSLTYWDDNHTAKNNLRVLLGEPKQKRTIIEKLFPKK